MTVRDAIQRSTQFLAGKGIDSPRLQAELLLAEMLQLPRLQLYLNFNRELSSAEIGLLRQRVLDRSRHIPLQHILGTVSFCGLEIKVTPQALVPRPETELLAEHSWKFLQSHPSARPQALDFATGTGCLAIAIAHFVPQAYVVASDLSGDALDLARVNRDHHHLAGRVALLQMDRLSAFCRAPSFDLIVSNPPYIPSGEIPKLMPEVRDHDPPTALDGGRDGLTFFRCLAQDAPPILRPGGKLMAEFGEGQAPAIQTLFANAGWTETIVLHDDTARPRYLIATRATAG